MKWIQERDLLLAQTMAFVQSVTGKKPDLSAAPVPQQPAPIENQPSLAMPAPDAAKHPRPESSKMEGKVAETARIENAASTEPPRSAVLMPPFRTSAQNDVRQEIQDRVAAFQAHQHRFQRERDAYFKSVLTKLRSASENSPETPPPA